MSETETTMIHREISRKIRDRNGWPDADKPGVPLNPERDGYHWLAAIDAGEPTGHTAVMFWFAGMGFYAIEATPVTQRNLAAHWRYLGPCLLPAEVAAHQKVDYGREVMEA